jgi:hypothetical protein
MAVAKVIPGCIPFFSPLVQSLFVVERIHPLIPSLVSFIFLFYFFICFVLFRFYLAVLSLFLFLWLLLASFSLFNDCSVTKKKNPLRMLKLNVMHGVGTIFFYLNRNLTSGIFLHYQSCTLYILLAGLSYLEALKCLTYLGYHLYHASN